MDTEWIQTIQSLDHSDLYITTIICYIIHVHMLVGHIESYIMAQK